MNKTVPIELEAKIEAAKQQITKLGSGVIGLSGGVDSTLVAKLAYDVIGDRALAVIGESATLPESERDEAIDLARLIGMPYRIVQTDETDDLKFASNPSNRCYFCKTELYTKLREIADNENYHFVLDGTNLDDLGDYRPGLQANKEQQVISPLQDSGFTKQDIRDAAQFLNLPNWDKPAMPCLSSRFPYGQPIDKKALLMVEKGEKFLRKLGFKECRVRHFDKTAKLEVAESELARIVAEPARAEVVEYLRELGYVYVTLDLGGFTSGNMNKVLQAQQVVQIGRS